jgi:hypothetical protein
MTGSVVNMVMGAARPPVPQVGMGATVLLYTDRHAATIVAVERHGTRVVIQRDVATRTDSNGAFTESQAYSYRPNPNGQREAYTLRKNGAWVREGDPMKSGERLSIGHRSEYYDFSF